MRRKCSYAHVNFARIEGTALQLNLCEGGSSSIRCGVKKIDALRSCSSLARGLAAKHDLVTAAELKPASVAQLPCAALRCQCDSY